MFEIFVGPDALFRFRLTAPDGTVVAVSESFADKPAAVAAIAAVREYAGMGHISDLTTADNGFRQSETAAAGSLRQGTGPKEMPATAAWPRSGSRPANPPPRPPRQIVPVFQ